jgi:hypothetical protein
MSVRLEIRSPQAFLVGVSSPLGAVQSVGGVW